MKKKITGRRILSLLLAAVLATSLCVPALATGTGSLSNFTRKQTYDGRFTDVKQSAYYYEGVKLCYETGILNGTSATTFSPESNITADQLTIIAARIYNIYHGGTGEIPVSDSWPSDILTVKARVYLEDELGRGNVASFLYPDRAAQRRALGIFAQVLDDEALTPINHLTAVPDLAPFDTAPNFEMNGMEAGVLKLYNAGVLTGSDEYGTFNNTSNITRGAVAAIAARIVDPAQRKVLSLKEGKAPIVGVLDMSTTKLTKTNAVLDKYEKENSLTFIYVGREMAGVIEFNTETANGAQIDLTIRRGDGWRIEGLSFGAGSESQYEVIFALIDDVVEEASRQQIKDMLQERNKILSDGWTWENGYSQAGLDWKGKNQNTTITVGNVIFTWNYGTSGFTIATKSN